jgi:hypothetical protein
MRLLCSATRAPPSAGDEPEDRLVLLVAFHALLHATSGEATLYLAHAYFFGILRLVRVLAEQAFLCL